MIGATSLAGEAPIAVLVEAIEQLSGARTIETVAEVVRTSARRMSGAHGVTFVLRDGEFCHYLDEDAIGPLWKGRRFPLEACVSGWAMMNRETVVISEIRDDPRIPQDAYRPTFVRSLVITPVRPADPLAAIGAYWDHPRRPTDEEVESLAMMARATATALENVALLSTLEQSLARSEALIRELDHRVKNTLAATLSIANQTLKGAASPESFVEGFNGRLMALSQAHEVLASHDWTGATLKECLDRAIGPAPEVLEGRLRLTADAGLLANETAISLILALHELLDNARRHGSLSVAGGHVDLTLSFEGELFRMRWVERGGPTATPRRRGFGLRLAEAGLARDLGGDAEVRFGNEGLVYDLTAPVSARLAPLDKGAAAFGGGGA
ncbi:MAG: GAF domain-containing protein [Caulobacteraceae bacterium]|nr:MAG: GAF domain-containing protein [Caulobacteraceae bacterium]